MLKKKCQEIADSAFYNELRIPDKMLFIKKVMASCKTSKQLTSTLEWGRKVIYNAWELHDQNAFDKYDAITAFRINSKFADNVKLVDHELYESYVELLRQL